MRRHTENLPEFHQTVRHGMEREEFFTCSKINVTEQVQQAHYSATCRRYESTTNLFEDSCQPALAV